MAADGSIIIETNVDDREAQKELTRLNKKLQTLNDKIYVQQQRKMPLVQQSAELGARLDAAKKKLFEMQNGSVGSFSKDAISEQTETVTALQTEWNQIQREVERIDASLQKSNLEMDLAKEKSGEIQKSMSETGHSTEKMAAATEKAQKGAGRFATRMKGIVASALVFNIISAGLRQFTQWVGRAVKSNDEAAAAIARLKGALLTLAQPLIEVIIPALTTFVNVLARIVSAAASLVSALFGTTAESSADSAEGLYEEMNAMEGVGSAAKKAEKSLAGFDEINQLSGSQAGGGGSGGGAVGGISPDFSGPIKDGLTGIVELFTGAALLALGAILTFSGANIPVGLGLMALGALAIYDAVSTNWNSIAELLQGPIGVAVSVISTALLVIGAVLVFSGVSVPLGIGLMAAGAVGLAAAATANWEYIVEALEGPIGTATAAISAAVLLLGAILTFTGANLPLGIGLMVVGAAGLAAVAAVNWDTIIDALQGPIGGITAAISSALLVVGAILTFSGANLPLGIGIMAAGAVGLATAAALNWDKIVTSLQGTIGRVTAIASAALLVLGIILCATGVALPLGIALIAAGAAGLVTVAAINWDAILDSLKDVWDKIKNWWNTSVAKYFTADFWKQLGKDMINGFLEALETGINFVLSGIGSMANGIINTLNKIPGVDIDTVDWGNVQLPRLAQGAVIPPNREFLAVLGDQKHGTNIEAPADLIRQIVRSELQNTGFGGGEHTAILEVDKIQLGKVIYKLNREESRRIGVNLAGV